VEALFFGLNIAKRGNTLIQFSHLFFTPTPAAPTIGASGICEPFEKFIRVQTKAITMYAGYVFICNNASQEQCLNRKLYACADKEIAPEEKIKRGATIFLYNTDTRALLGPFTALSEGGEELEEGSWAIDIDEHSFSENVKVGWEKLHLLQNAAEVLPFLKDAKTCSLTETDTQRALDLLKEAPPYVHEAKEAK
jgi:hypothetical protein